MTIIQELVSGLEQYLARGIGGSELVEYSIFSNPSTHEEYGTELEIGYYDNIIHAYNHDEHHKSFVRSVFARLDPLLDLDFVEVGSSGNADINIFRSWYNSYYEEIDLLGNDPSNGTGGGTAHYDYNHIDISWKDYYDSDPFTASEKSTIVHEIGHAFGLNDLAFEPRWDSYDSIMSYNQLAGFPVNIWFTEADIKAMQNIWGVEDDQFNSPPPTLVVDGFVSAGNIVGEWIDNSFVVKSSIIKDISDIHLMEVIAPTWSDFVQLERVAQAKDGGGLIQGKRLDMYFTTPKCSALNGSSGDDTIRGLAGWDVIDGGAGDDLIHGGNGRDIIAGGTGSDELHGDFGWNTYKDQRDGFTDLIAIKSDQHLNNWWYGTSGNNPNGEKADFIEGLDRFDQIKIIGVSTQDLSFKDGVTARGAIGIGIYAKGALEAVYTGENLSLDQISQMTSGDGSSDAINNLMWSYWGDNNAPWLLA